MAVLAMAQCRLQPWLSQPAALAVAACTPWTQAAPPCPMSMCMLHVHVHAHVHVHVHVHAHVRVCVAGCNLMYCRLQPYVLQAAIDKLERALELLPEDSDAWYSLGVLLSDQGRKEEAVAAYTRSVTINAGRRARSALAAPRAAPRLAASASVAWSAAQLAAHGFGPGLLYAL